MPGESDNSYVSRLACELDEEFRRVGPTTVCAFVAEPVVGAVSEPAWTSGCTTHGLLTR
jgi:adenosylmethionine-8-amino-7-oxononanoate aminotransferase